MFIIASPFIIGLKLAPINLLRLSHWSTWFKLRTIQSPTSLFLYIVRTYIRSTERGAHKDNIIYDPTFTLHFNSSIIRIILWPKFVQAFIFKEGICSQGWSLGWKTTTEHTNYLCGFVWSQKYIELVWRMLLLNITFLETTTIQVFTTAWSDLTLWPELIISTQH